MILSPDLINGGTVILIPFSKVAGLYDEDAVCPFDCSISNFYQLILYEDGKSTDKA